LLIAWTVTFVTLVFQKSIDVATYFFALSVGFLLVAVVLLFAFREYSKNLNSIDDLIENVNKGKPLPSLRELKKTRKNNQT
jgi:HAMP domain-containing protein